MRSLYTLLFTLALPVILFRLWWRGRQLPAYRRRWGERFALFPTPPASDKPFIWVHTVSVGEFIAAKPMLDRLLASGRWRLAVTTTTPTGSERVKAAYGNSVFHVYAPYDISFLVNRFLKKLRPSLAIMLETELWPNILHCCHRRKIPTLLANGRLSEKSAAGYRRVPALSRPMMTHLSMAAIQNTEDAGRFMALGLAEEKARITGSIKFDIRIDDTLKARAIRLKESLSNHYQCSVWIAASTHKSEDEIVLDAFAQARTTNDKLRLILVPRHPDRFDSVYQLCLERGFHTLRRSLVGDHIGAAPFDILLGDTMGEMMLLYGSSDLAFVGGSLVANGGHNMIEPAVWALPIIMGPSQFNFAEISRLLLDAHGMKTVVSARQISDAVNALLNTEQGTRMGAAAAAVAHANQGALDRLLALIDELTAHK